jgi:hypothetical protein
MNIIKKYWNEKPLMVILLSAIIFRLIAVIFSKGWGMLDDHFLVIEPAQAWADGLNYNHWLPDAHGGGSQPDGHSFLYSGIHYLLFCLCGLLNFNDPQAKMYLVRFLHAAFSLITVYYGYKLTEKLSGKDEAKLAGLLLAIFWVFPFASVRNLVEVVCIPFLMVGVWYICKARETGRGMWLYFIAGVIMGLGFSIRFQTAIFISGVGLVMILSGQWRPLFSFAAGVLLSIIADQGVIDYYVWGYPFAEVGEYIRYNIAAANDYITGPWYRYLVFLSIFLIPPVSFFLFFGFFRVWKKHLLLFLPVLIFMLFHSIFPNKQERFILPVIPFIIILGVIGWTEFVRKSTFWRRYPGLLRVCWLFFWVINTAALFMITPMYSKKARVEAMVYLSRYKEIKNILLEDSNRNGVVIIPQFYLHQWVKTEEISKNKPFGQYAKWMDSIHASEYPRFVIFYGPEQLEQRVQQLKKSLPGIVYETTIDPGFIDAILYHANPVNANQTIYIYRNTDLIPGKITYKP